MKLIHSRPDLSVVRIYKQQEVVGAGFIVSDEYILTCAHVVATALGIDSDSPQTPTQEVELDFPTIQPIETLTATVEFWLPVNPGNSPEDIAVLKLIQPPPKEAQPAALSMTKDQLSGHEFEVLGFPEGRSGGAWAEGVIKRRVGYGWIQLVDRQVTGYRLEEGFSGAPIWDKKIGAVVGIAVAADKGRSEVKAAFMIPTELLLKAWKKLLEICVVDSRIQSLITLLEPYFQDFNNEIRNAYQQSLPQLSVRNFPDSIVKIVRSLDTRKDNSEDNYSCLEKFVGYLLLNLKNSDLEGKHFIFVNLLSKLTRIIGFKGIIENVMGKIGMLPLEEQLRQSLTNWLERYLGNYQDLLELLKSKRKIEKVLKGSQEPCLLIGVFDDNNSLVVQGWLIEDIKSYKSIEGVDCYSLANEEAKVTTDKNLSNLPELLQSFYQQSLVRCQCNIQKIHVFLPYSLIDRQERSIDSLVIEEKNPFVPPIGAKYEVVVRFSERLKVSQDDQYSVIYKEKWQIVKDNLEKSVINILELSENTNPNKLYKQLMPERVVGARLSAPISKAKLEFIMQAFYFAGIPIALWLREEASNLNCCQELNNICQECCLEELPRNIKNRRYQDWGADTNAIGNHLSLLWDDFDLVPKRELIMS